MFIAQVAPLDQHLPARAREAGPAADEPAGLGPGGLGQAARLAAVAPLEVDDLALGDLQQQRLRNPLIVDVGLAYVLDQVLGILRRACKSSRVMPVHAPLIHPFACSVVVRLMPFARCQGTRKVTWVQSPSETKSGVLGAASRLQPTVIPVGGQPLSCHAGRLCFAVSNSERCGGGTPDG